MDVLNDILDVMKFKGCVYFTTQLSPPFGIEVPAYQRVARFHMAVNGSCWIRVKGDPEPLLLNHGDFVVVPHGAGHILNDHPDTPVLTLDKVLEKSGFQPGQNLGFWGSGRFRSARLICGHFEFDEDWNHPLFAQLPSHIFVKGSRSLDFGWFDQALAVYRLRGPFRPAGKPVYCETAYGNSVHSRDSGMEPARTPNRLCGGPWRCRHWPQPKGLSRAHCRKMDGCGFGQDRNPLANRV